MHYILVLQAIFAAIIMYGRCMNIIIKDIKYDQPRWVVDTDARSGPPPATPSPLPPVIR